MVDLEAAEAAEVVPEVSLHHRAVEELNSLALPDTAYPCPWSIRQIWLTGWQGGRGDSRGGRGGFGGRGAPRGGVKGGRGTSRGGRSGGAKGGAKVILV